MSKWRLSLAVLAITAVTVLGSTINAVIAQQAGGSGLQISPTRTELSVSPGEIKEFSVVVKNVTPGDITAKAFLNDFEADNVTGEPKIIVDDRKNNPGSLKSYLKGLQDFDLKSGESKEVKLSIDASADMPAGGYYGAVRFAAVPKGSQQSEADRQVALTASVASLVLVEVSGNITEQAQVNSVKIYRNKKASSFFMSAPNNIGVEIRNSGNTFSKPFGRVTVNKAGGKEIFAYELNNKDPRGNVLPNSSRTFIDELKNVKTPGRYTVTANVSHGNGGEVITSKVSFWYIPAWLLAVIVVLLLAAVGGAYYLYKKQFKGKRKK
jgi:archaellin